MSKKSQLEESRQEAIKTLRKMGVRPGATVYTNVTSVSRSGMSRTIRCYVVTRNTSTDYRTGKKTVEHGITDITGLVATACGFRRDKRGWDIVRGGCGMDMCFQTVYLLGRTMFPEGGPLEHSNGTRQRQEKEKGRETDGGYLLQKRDL